ncbi:MAG: hypothetical protein GY711_20245 [bacterium]|nr:hypothetical protein [bacterium]
MKRRKWLKKLAISLGTLVLLGIVGELVTRALEPGPFALLDSNPYLDHESRGHRHRPNFAGRWDGTWYATDSRGLRGPELELDFEPDEYRVVCLGDSCTFGKGVVEADSWPRQLERLLGEKAAGADWHPVVANLGVNGYSGRAYEEMYREIGAELKPNLVVIGYNLNDFPNAIRAVDQEVFNRRGLRTAMPTGVRDFLGRFGLYRFARQTYYHMNRAKDWKNAEGFAKGAGESSADSEVWRKQRGYLEAIRDAARASGAQMAVFLFPYESQVYLDSFETAPIDRLRQTCHEIGVPFVDLAEEFRGAARAETPPKQLFLRGDRYHPNSEGYGIVATAVVRTLVEQKWLPGSTEERDQ